MVFEIFDFFSFIVVTRPPDLVIFRPFFRNNFFLLKMTQNGSIREKKWLEPKFENFAFPLGTRVPDLVVFRRFLKMKSLSIFWTLAVWICLILHIMIVLIVLNHLTTTNYLAGWHNYAKWDWICEKKFKISIFDQFFDVCGLNMLDIADSSSPTGSPCN